MRYLRKLRLRFRSLFAKQRVEEDLETELRDYMEREVEAQIATGVSPEEARRSVARGMQRKTQMEEECRDARGTDFFELWFRDMRYGWRTLRKNPGFSVTAVLTLALGIGTSTTLFSLVESQLWRPVALPHSERLMVLFERNVKAKWQQSSVSVPNFADWRQRNRTFENLAAMQWPKRRNFAGNGYTERPMVAAISSGFFETLGVQPEFGRTTDRKDEQPGQPPVALLGAALARNAFGIPSAALGKTIQLDGERYVVSGILPERFRLEVLQTPDIFVPLTVSTAIPRDIRSLVVFGRLKDGITPAQGLADLESVTQGIAAEHPDTNSGFGVMMDPLNGSFVAQSTRTWLLLLLAFSLFILLIAWPMSRRCN